MDSEAVDTNANNIERPPAQSFDDFYPIIEELIEKNHELEEKNARLLDALQRANERVARLEQLAARLGDQTATRTENPAAPRPPAQTLVLPQPQTTEGASEPFPGVDASIRNSLVAQARTTTEPPPTSQQETPPHRSSKPGRTLDVLCVLVLSGLVLFAIRDVLFGQGYLPGADQYGHLFKIWHAAKALAETGRFPLWMPQWYNGLDYMQYYPILYTLLGVPIQLITGDVHTTYRVLLAATVVGSALGAYLTAREWMARAAAVATALLFALSSVEVKHLFVDGGQPQALAIAFSPWALLLCWRLLNRPSKRLSVALALVVALMIVAHQMQAVMFLEALAIFLLVAAVGARHPLSRILAAGVPVLFGIVLSLVWLLPGVTHFDLQAVPFLQPEKVSGYSATLAIFDPVLWGKTRFGLYYGLPIVAVAAGSLAFGLSAHRLALLTAGLLSLLFAFGSNFPFYDWLPLSQQLLPNRYLHVSSLFLVLCAGQFLQGTMAHRSRLRPLLLSAALLAAVSLGVDQARYLDLARMGVFPNLESVSGTLNKHPSSGRFHGTLLSGLSELTHFPVVGNGRLLTGGWNLAGSLTYEALLPTGQYVELGRPDYIPHYLSLWNASQVAIRTLQGPEADALRRYGYRVVNELPGFAMLSTQQAPGYLMKQDRDVLAIGVDARHLVALFPWTAVGHSWYMDDYTEDYLATFKMVLLYQTRVRDQFKAMQVIERMLERGQVVIIASEEPSMTRMQGVAVERRHIEGEIAATITGGDVLGEARQTQLGPFRDAGGPWGAIHYRGMDRVLIEVERDFTDPPLPLFGYKETPRGRLYFLGFNLLHHAIFNRDDASTALIDQILDMVQPNREVFPSSLGASFRWGVDHFEFDYSLQSPTPAILSVTYSPHWRATVNGQPLPYVSHENLMLVQLPAGQATVQFDYTFTPIQYAGAALSLLGLVGLSLFLTIAWRPLMRLQFIPLDLLRSVRSR